jgi:hypothetical protein
VPLFRCDAPRLATRRTPQLIGERLGSEGRTADEGCRIVISNNPCTIEAAVNRLTRELVELNRIFYGAHERSSRFLYAGMLERKRDDFVRGAALQMHTAIEDILDDLIRDKLLGVKPRAQKRRARAMHTKRGVIAHDLLGGSRSLGFAQKVRLALALGLISTRLGKKLNELNKIRNVCSHNWLLNVRIHRNRGPQQQKPFLLAYQGRSLHKAEIFEDFIGDFSGVYLRLLRKV